MLGSPASSVVFMLMLWRAVGCFWQLLCLPSVSLTVVLSIKISEGLYGMNGMQAPIGYQIHAGHALSQTAGSIHNPCEDDCGHCFGPCGVQLCFDKLDPSYIKASSEAEQTKG